MLLSLTLENWRSHAHTRLEFALGANILLGPMGAGKSSAVDAMCFALFGTYPKLQRRDASVDDVENFRHAGKGVAAELEWQEGAGGRKYRVRRELGKKADAWLYADGKLLQKGPKAVSASCEEALGIDYDLFSRAVYSEQNRMDYWLSLPPGARKAELDRLLGLDAFERARANAANDINKKKALAASMEAMATPEALSRASEREKAALDALRGAKEETAKLSSELALAKASALLAREKFASYEKKRMEHEKLGREVAAMQGKTDALRARAKQLELMRAEGAIADEIRAVALARKNAENAIASLEADMRKAKGEEGALSSLVAQARKAREKIAQLQKESSALLDGKTEEQLRDEIDRAKARCEALRERAAMADAQIRTLDASLSALGAGGKASECPLCGAPLDGEHKARLEGEKKESVKRAQSDAADAKRLLAKATADGERAGKTLEACARIGAQIIAGAPPDVGEAEAKLAKVKAGMVELEMKRGALEKTFRATLDDEKRLGAEAAGAKEAREAKESLAVANEAKAALESRRAQLQFNEAEWKALENARGEAEKKLAGLQAHCDGAARIADASLKIAEAAARERGALEKAREEGGKIRKEMDELSSFKEALLATQSQVRALLIGEINSALERVWKLIYPYSDWKGLRLHADERDYALEVWQGEWKALEKFASGGERASAALAMRVAMSAILTPHLGWIVLDEPTHNLDERAVLMLGEALSDHLPKAIPQAIVITHDGALVESAPGKVFRFARQKGDQGDTTVSCE